MNYNLNDKKIIEAAGKLIENYDLCDSCFGRNFAKIGFGISNKKRGNILRQNLKISKETKISKCWLCSGLLDEIPEFAKIICERLIDYEYDTFLIGSKVDEEILEKEKELFEFTSLDLWESIKSELNREIGKTLEKKLKQEVDFEKPTIMAIIDTCFDVVNLQVKSLYFYGRYKKFRRDIPQTKWLCRICHGKGCKKCLFHGKLYKNSVEELIADRILQVTFGDDESFHGCGREDIDVRMLGNGRPFVLEIKNPKKRTINLKKLTEQINNRNKKNIEVSCLRYSDKKEVIRIKDAVFKKTYRAVIECSEPLNNEKLIKAIQTLQDSGIKQLTPNRVAHRRANLVREKHIYNCKVESIKDTRAVITFEAESGTYIKELVSGDEGRTKPSISEIIGAPCMVTELDVTELKGE
jgi:tRNA pseudouridine synthase 10